MPDQLTPLPHDGWKSRTYLTTIAVLVVIVSIATASMFIHDGPDTRIMQASQWIELIKWLVPTVLLVGLGKAGSDKWAEAKRK